MLKRALNVGFSGGEKKRLEILQMALFEPKLAILDETDSGLDIDALKLVAEGVNALRAPDRAMLVITHYQRLLELHRARSRACAVRRPHHQGRRQGIGARTRSQGLRADREGRGMTMALPSLDTRRAEAAERFRAKGVPHRRIEEWKYSDLRGALGDARRCCGRFGLVAH